MSRRTLSSFWNERYVRVERVEDRLDDLLGAERLDVGLADELYDAPIHRWRTVPA
jgi:hypothetical protein